MTKELFVKTLNNIKQQQIRVDKFNCALDELCDGYPIFDVNNLYLEALLDILHEDMRDDDDFIGWWLWEDVEKKVWLTEEDGSKREIILDTPAQLYDFLTRA